MQILKTAFRKIGGFLLMTLIGIVKQGLLTKGKLAFNGITRQHKSCY